MDVTWNGWDRDCFRTSIGRTHRVAAIIDGDVLFCSRDLIFRWATSTIEFTGRRVLFWLYHGWNDHADKYLYQYLSGIYV